MRRERLKRATWAACDPPKPRVPAFQILAKVCTKLGDTLYEHRRRLGWDWTMETRMLLALRDCASEAAQVGTKWERRSTPWVACEAANWLLAHHTPETIRLEQKARWPVDPWG